MSAPAVVVTIALPGATAVTAFAAAVEIDRGKSGGGVLDQFDAGTCSVTLNNHTRRFDPMYTAGPYFGAIVPGVSITVTAGGVTIFTGRVDDWNFEYDAESKRSTAQAVCSDALAVLGRAKFGEWTANAGDLAGARLTAVLARPEVAWAGATDLDVGTSYLQGDLVAFGTNALGYCQLVASSDLGLFFASRVNALTFLDRHAFISQPSAATFGPGLTDIRFSAVHPSFGTELLFNQVNIAAAGSDSSYLIEDTTSIAAYGQVYTLDPSPTDLLLLSDVDVIELGSHIVDVFSDPVYRFDSITVPVHRLAPAQQATVLALDIGSLVAVTWTPNSIGSAIARTCYVEGVSHSSSHAEGVHEMTFTLNDSGVIQTGNFFRVGDATYGRIGAGGLTDYPIAF